MMTLRITAERRMDMMVFPSNLNVHTLRQSSSVAAAIFSRSSATPLSKIASSSAREVPRVGW
jgi:hypothetical protein